ncbi:MAG TPA: SurA N-terminal domain-containing protein [Methylomirabilota bacterium]|nr:SurA N-terminal domain-containing protein [Methylomirabilota bacterium]
MATKVSTSKTTKKITKKAAPKTSAKTRTQVQSLAVTTSPNTQTRPVRKSLLIAVAVIIILGALLYAGRGLFVAAIVNGQPISRLSIVKEAEKQSGKQALDTMIRNILVEQEARKANVTVNDKEVDDEIKNVETNITKQGQKLDQVLAMQGMTRDDLRKLIRLNKLVGKIVGKDVKVADKEIDDYIATNKDSLPQGQSDAQLRASVKNRLQQEKLNQKVSQWVQSLQSKAKVIYFVQY